MVSHRESDMLHSAGGRLQGTRNYFCSGRTANACSPFLATFFSIM